MVVVEGCSYYATCNSGGRVGAVVTTPLLVMMVGRWWLCTSGVVSEVVGGILTLDMRKVKRFS